MVALEALVGLLVEIGEERPARRIGSVWLALRELIARDAPIAEKAALTATLREVFNEPPGVMRLRVHPATPALIDEAQRLNDQLDSLRRRVWELSTLYD